jgi:uncharacterized protein (DUF3084 family)
MSAVAKLSLEEYQDLKSKGIIDSEIARKKGIAPSRICQLKKEWGITKPTTSEIKQPKGKAKEKEIKVENTPFEEDRTTKLEFENKQLKERLAELETVYAYCKEEADSLQKENRNLENSFIDSRDRVIKQDYQIENQKQTLVHIRKTLEQYEDENKSLRTIVRELVKMWM